MNAGLFQFLFGLVQQKLCFLDLPVFDFTFFVLFQKGLDEFKAIAVHVLLSLALALVEEFLQDLVELHILDGTPERARLDLAHQNVQGVYASCLGGHLDLVIYVALAVVVGG